MPSGTPITPSGIWSSVNATLNAVTRADAERRRERVTTTNVIWVAPRPIARGAISASAWRACRVARIDAAAGSGSRAAQRRQLDEQVAERAGDDADREARRRPSTGQEDAAADDREVVDDRRDRGGREPAAGR